VQQLMNDNTSISLSSKWLKVFDLCIDSQSFNSEVFDNAMHKLISFASWKSEIQSSALNNLLYPVNKVLLEG
jgi:metal-responsive CopG/Arc/MetJ family transcriptional regulator